MDEKSLQKKGSNPPAESQSKSEIVYKSSHIFEILPACTLGLSYFKKLHEILKTSAEEGADIEIARVSKTPGQLDEEFEGFKKAAKLLYIVTIHIFDSRGGYIITESSSIFDEARLPDSISKIIFDNTQRFKAILPQREPVHKVRVTFDFSKPAIFDFISAPSYATINNSNIEIIGETETWVHGTYKKVMESLKDRSNRHGWLNAANVYDVFLWFLVVPLNLRLLYKINLYLQPSLADVSTFLKIGIYLYFFILLLYVYRIIFNYARWVFPKIEFITSLQHGAIIHRLVLGALLLGIASTYLSEIIKMVMGILK